jgi:hypothetical protein
MKILLQVQQQQPKLLVMMGGECLDLENYQEELVHNCSKFSF